jgi:hypothetical protein
VVPVWVLTVAVFESVCFSSPHPKIREPANTSTVTVAIVLIENALTLCPSF